MLQMLRCEPCGCPYEGIVWVRLWLVRDGLVKSIDVSWPFATKYVPKLLERHGVNEDDTPGLWHGRPVVLKSAA